MVQHIEFFHRDHFQLNYHRKKAGGDLSQFIDFFWETDFDRLWELYPDGFADLLFPNVGYTYLVNLGTPFTMQINDDAFVMNKDGFLPRNKNIACTHSPGNKIFGIKFKVSPVIFEKKVNFSEYTFISPLSYLIDRNVVDQLKKAAAFAERVNIISAYYAEMLRKYMGSMNFVNVVTGVISGESKNNFCTPVELLAAQNNISSRTLHRYFETATGIGCKQALQMMRIRKALSEFILAPKAFNYKTYGYYDHSHFYKYAKQFLSGHQLARIQTHLHLLKGAGTIDY